MLYRVILERQVYSVIEIESGDNTDRGELCEVAAQAWKAEGYEPDFGGEPWVLWIAEMDQP